MSNLFEPFAQGDRSEQSPRGTGLGLTISQQLSPHMQGGVTANREQDPGTLLKFVLSIRRGKVFHCQTPKLIRNVIRLVPDQPTSPILIVEDTQINRLLRSETPTSVVFEVRQTLNEQGIIELGRSWLRRLIWMDIQMPIEKPERILSSGGNAFVTKQVSKALSKPLKRAVIIDKKNSEYLGVRYDYQLEAGK